ncbi:MAG TPA: ergothioneine biosynthesis protein EgtC [Trebonia sp.]|nr:ergothioneine biosynthesis protein EgtC [Trebonia sp.]
MCRHLAYLGPPVSLQSLLIDPEHGLYQQSWAPRMQSHGTVNADGFGVGWYVPDDPMPARYRRGVPIWGDPSLADVARVTRSGAVLAAVRSATLGMAMGEAAAAPFCSGAWLFSHNGVMEGWPSLPLPQVSLPAMEAMTDSAYLWALVLDLLREGAVPEAALAAAIHIVRRAGISGRFNFLWTDGATIAATACGDTLWYRTTSGEGPGLDSVTVASEPSDDLPGWTEVPDEHVLTAVRGLVEMHPLSAFTEGITTK